MPFTEKITVSRDGTTSGASGISNNPPLATLAGNAVEIKWGDSTYAVAGDSSRILATKYKMTMPEHLIGLFVPKAPFLSGGAEAVIIRPTIVKNGDSLYVTAVNYSASTSFNVTSGALLGTVIFVEGKSIMTT